MKHHKEMAAIEVATSTATANATDADYDASYSIQNVTAIVKSES